MILCEFNIPWADNNGNPQSQVHKRLAQRLLREFGGCTYHDAKGEWRKGGRDFIEMVTVYRVAVSAPLDIIRLKEVANDAARELKQQAYFFAVIGKAEVIPVTEKANAQPGKDQS